MTKIIQRGAEATISLSNNKVLKHRVPKSYRLPALDNKLRRSRTKKEAKLLLKASKLIPIPTLLSSDDKEKIEMQYIEGLKLSEHLDELDNSEEICEVIGKQIGKLHDADIIHGDLTTSNMILSDNNLFFIDFGLGYTSSKTEDKAVDLHLIKQALEAKHYKNFKSFFQAVLKGYKSSPLSAEVLKRLQKVELRGRYKQQY
jgi:TP53 regulating kinase and related kinases